MVDAKSGLGMTEQQGQQGRGPGGWNRQGRGGQDGPDGGGTFVLGQV